MCHDGYGPWQLRHSGVSLVQAVVCIAALTASLQTFAMGSCMPKGVAFVALCNVKLGVVAFSFVEATIYDNAFFNTVVGFERVISEYDDRVVLCGFIGAATEW
jgi:hypothetical protein